MSAFLARVVVCALALLAAGAMFSELVQVRSLEGAVIFAVVLGVLNAVIRPVIILLTLPINLLTLGLFTLVVNALVFWLATLAPVGVHVSGFAGALVGSLTISAVSFAASRL